MATVTAEVTNIETGEAKEFSFEVDADHWRGLGDGGKQKEILCMLEINIARVEFRPEEVEDEEEEYNSDVKLDRTV